MLVVSDEYCMMPLLMHDGYRRGSVDDAVTIIFRHYDRCTSADRNIAKKAEHTGSRRKWDFSSFIRHCE